MDGKYRDALHAAQEELKRIEERRAVLLRLIQNLKELSTDENYELTPPPGYVPKGLTEEIRTIMALTTVHLSAVQIRDALVLRGFEYSSPRNLLMNVHTVIGRIEDELDVVERDGGKAYKGKAAPSLAQFAGFAGPFDPLEGLGTPAVPKRLVGTPPTRRGFGQRLADRADKK